MSDVLWTIPENKFAGTKEHIDEMLSDVVCKGDGS